ncbi:MAG: DsrE family protein [Chitinophagaceae bacterium]|nr:DsrE family protein [Chitinophagaceae bacterium]
MKNLITIIIGLFLLTHATQIKAQNTAHKVVFQFTNANDTLQQKAFVKQLENLTGFWPEAQIEVVLYNQGVELVMLNNTTYVDRVKALHQQGVRFVICENTLKNRKIGKDAFDAEWVEFTPAGIAEIVLKQEQGWSYIKGGF